MNVYEMRRMTMKELLVVAWRWRRRRRRRETGGTWIVVVIIVGLFPTLLISFFISLSFGFVVFIIKRVFQFTTALCCVESSGEWRRDRWRVLHFIHHIHLSGSIISVCIITAKGFKQRRKAKNVSSSPHHPILLYFFIPFKRWYDDGMTTTVHSFIGVMRGKKVLVVWGLFISNHIHPRVLGQLSLCSFFLSRWCWCCLKKINERKERSEDDAKRKTRIIFFNVIIIGDRGKFSGWWWSLIMIMVMGLGIIIT